MPAAKLYTAQGVSENRAAPADSCAVGNDAFTFTLHLDWGVVRGTSTLGITKMTLHNGGLLRSVCVRQYSIYR